MDARPTPPPSLPPLSPIPTEGLGWNSRILRTAFERIRTWVIEKTQESVARKLDENAEFLQRVLLESGTQLYFEGREYTRKVDRWLIESYLTVLERKLEEQQRATLPEISIQELLEELTPWGGEASEQELVPICRDLGIPIR